MTFFISPGCRMSVPRFAVPVSAKSVEITTLRGRIRRICECGSPADDKHMKDKIFVCERCKFLDGSGWTDGLIVSMLRDVRVMSFAEIVEALTSDDRSTQRVLKRMIERGRLERVLVEVDPGRESRGSETRWMYRLCG